MAVDQSLGTAFVEIKANLTGLQTGLAKAQTITNQATKGINRSFKRVAVEVSALGTAFQENSKIMAESFKKVGRRLSLFLTVPILALGGKFLKVASDAVEMRNLFDITFGDAARDVEEFSERTAIALNRSSLDLMKTAATFAAFLKPLGVAPDQIVPMSKALTVLTEDIASFRNLTKEETLTKLFSGLTGQARAVRTLGIDLGAAAVEQELFNLGIEGGIKGATQAQKVLARFNIVMAQTTDAQGDAARTAQSFENQLKGLQGAFKDLSADLGALLIPVALQVVGIVREWAGQFNALSDSTKTTILGIAGVAAAVGPLLIVLGILISTVSTLAGVLIALGAIPIVAIAAVVAGIALLGLTLFGLVTATEKAVMVSEEHAEAMREIKKLTDEAAGASKERSVALLLEASAEAVAARETAKRRKAAAEARIAELKAAAPFQTLIGADVDISGLKEAQEELASANLEIKETTDSLNRLDQAIIGASFSVDTLASSEDDLGGSIDEVNKKLEEQRTALATLLDRLFPIKKAVRDFLDEARLLGESFKIGDLDDAEFKEALAALVREAKEAGVEISKAISDGIQQGTEQGGDEGEKILTQTSDFIRDVAANVAFAVGRSIKDMITGATSLMDGLKSLALNVIDIVLQAIIQAAVLKLIGGIFGGSLIGSAKGNAFSGGQVMPFQKGGLISGRTTFPMGLAGEAGPEAIFPLTRMPGGEMGIRAETGGGQSVVIEQTNNFELGIKNDMFAAIAQAAPLLVEASRNATIEGLQGRRT